MDHKNLLAEVGRIQLEHHCTDLFVVHNLADRSSDPVVDNLDVAVDSHTGHRHETGRSAGLVVGNLGRLELERSNSVDSGCKGLSSWCCSGNVIKSEVGENVS